MITHLDKEETRRIRHIMLSDSVYLIFHDALKKWNKEEKTLLSPQEIMLAAHEFSLLLIHLPDLDEGIEDEMEDLEEEADNETDAMLIMMMSAAMLQAYAIAKGKLMRTAILAIFKRWQHHPLYNPFLMEGCKKEMERWAEDKRNNLISYELKQIELEQKSEEGIKQLIAELLTPTWGKSQETIKEILLALGKYNIEHHHCLDSQLLCLYKQLAPKADMSVQGSNQGIMAGRDLHADFTLTDRQVEIMAHQLTKSQMSHLSIGA